MKPYLNIACVIEIKYVLVKLQTKSLKISNKLKDTRWDNIIQKLMKNNCNSNTAVVLDKIQQEVTFKSSAQQKKGVKARK